MKSPYKVPPFAAKPPKEPIKTFFWWSWHPLYPYWSKSCWGGATKEEAVKDIECECACGMDVYHNKLIQEIEGKYIEILDRPCKRLDVWVKIYKNSLLSVSKKQKILKKK
jgi:hypothetical protein